MKQPTVLCLNGGGIRGALQIGALLELGSHHFPDGIYGISIGSVIGSLLAFRFTPTEIEACASELLRLEDLLDPPRLQTVLELPNRMGLDTGERIHNCLRSIFATKNLNFDMLTIDNASVPLYIVASDITRCKTVVFDNWVRLWDAIRASISLPLVFTPHIIQNRVFMDGAVLCKNILKMVPSSERENALVLLCDNTSPNIETPTKLMQRVLHAQSTVEMKWMCTRYPKNVCVLTETSTGMLDLAPDIPNLIETGRLLMRDFLSKSGT